MNTPENSERIDDWASRLIDGDVSLDDVDEALRDDVVARAERFARVRRTLRAASANAPTDTDDVVARVMAEVVPGSGGVRRRSGVWVSGLVAAAAVATIVGVAVSSSGRTSSDEAADEATRATPGSDVALDMKVAVAATEAPAAAAIDAELATTEAPAATKESGSDATADSGPAVTTFGAGDACPDELRPTIVPLAVVDGENVEIHWSAEHGVVVYRISDCSVVLATTP